MSAYRLFWIACFLTFLQYIAANDKKDQLVFNGQAVTWITTQFQQPPVFQPGFRFVPSFTGKFDLKNNHVRDYEASLNVNGHITFVDNQIMDTSFQFKPYRIWIRNATDTYEYRIGLQKINFGSAKMFRPLMWFDAMDVRDPLQLTDGVNAALFKCFFENNANVWVWGMLANQKPKGFELFGTQQFTPEAGAMFEFPAGPGEMGIATHYRKLNLAKNNFGDNNAFSVSDELLPLISISETRLGLFGKWDLEVGLWFESSISRFSENSFIPAWTDMWNVGADYTLSFGNGLGASLEYFRYHTGNKFITEGISVDVLGAMFNYPISLNDQISAMMFVLPENARVFNYISWNRTIENIVLYAIAYWNPEDANLLNFQSNSRNLYSGKGIQCMLSYHF